MIGKVNTSVADLGCRIPDPDFYPSRIPDPGVNKAPDPGSGSATLVNILDMFVDVQHLSSPKIIILQGVLWIRIRIRIGSEFNGVPGSVSASAFKIRIYKPFPNPDSLKMLDPDPYPD
jgi:hypothetical protein